MAKQRVPLHLAKSDPPMMLPSFNRLTRQYIHGSCSPGLRLIAHHVSQSLIIHHSYEDMRLHELPARPTVHLLIPMELESFSR